MALNYCILALLLLAANVVGKPFPGWPSGPYDGHSDWQSSTTSAPAAPTSPALASPTSSASGAPASSSSCQGYFAPLAPPYLNDLAHADGKMYFGSATDQPGTGEDTNILYQEILNDTHIFGQITPANDMKHFATEPEQGVFNYTGGDVVVAIAQDHGKVLRCHNLIWQSQLPDWVINGTWTAETLTAVMQNHITNLVTHSGDVCYAWDVFAQEAVESTGQDIKLYYNDYGIESPGNKSAAVFGLVQDLQSRNIRIDGIGLESHFTVGQTPSYDDQVTTKQSCTALGLEVAITELDIRFEDGATARTNTTGLALQAHNYYDSVKSCVDIDGCVGITVWDFDDQYSWIPQTFTGQGVADLYWEDFQRKPAYYACAEALQGQDCTVCG